MSFRDDTSRHACVLWDDTTRAFRWLRWLAIAALSVLGSGCGDSLPPLDETEMVREVIVADLLNPSEMKQSEPRISVVVDDGWPADTFLEIKGRVRSRSAEGGAVAVFRVEVDGREVFSREVEAKKKQAGFNADVPLEPVQGPAEVELVIDFPNSDKTSGRWQRAVIQSRKPMPRAAASDGPNLLFVVVDTLRADHCSLYGYPRATTPHLERLADSSLVFDEAQSQCSWTAPAVASMLTGLYPLQHGVVRGESLAPRFTTLGESLQAAGLTTFAVSTNPLIDQSAGYAQGFEIFHHAPWKRADEVNRFFYDWLPRVDGLRWFAYLHYTDPHSPYDAPAPDGEAFADPEYDGLFRDPAMIRKVRKEINFEGGTQHQVEERDLDYLRAVYDGEIRYWDRHFGELIQTLEERGLLDNTVVIVTSDHGEEFREHGKLMHGHHLYQESVRVPLLVRAPRLRPGRRPEPVETRALQRAALQLLRVSEGPLQPGDLMMPGEDRLPTFSHTVHKTAMDERRQEVVASVRDEDWKLIFWPNGGRTELFEMRSDAEEAFDVAAENPELVDRYLGLVETWLETGPADAVSDQSPTLDPELLEKLRALGYVP